ncbi:MAG: hypothetical protein ABI759_21125 [Candidatus Solibacter sp.]
MRALPIAICTIVAGVAFAPNSALANPTTLAQTGQITSTPQFSVMNSGSTITPSVSGQDSFTFVIPGMPFVGPVTANFNLNATSSEQGSCPTAGCPSGDGYTQQGYVGSFSYTVPCGISAGMNLLSGTSGVNATPFNSGGTFANNINGTGGSFLSSETPTNPTAILMSSDFLSFAGVFVQTGSWAFSGLSTSFVVNPTVTTLSKPLQGTTFLASAVGPFYSEPQPTIFDTPTPDSMTVLGCALVGLGLIGRKRTRG